ncbi:type II secretion system F family protein [Planctomycetota bacterium]
MLTCPFVSGAIYIIGVQNYDPFLFISGPVMFLAVLIIALLSKTDTESLNWYRIIVKTILYILLIIILIICLVSFGGSGSFGVILFALFIATIVRFAMISRDSTYLYVISTIGACIRQNLPLTIALDSVAGEQIDTRSKYLKNINKWLVQGYSLSESIKRGFPKCPGYAVAMIIQAEKMNQLPQALQSIEANMIAKADRSRKIKPVHPVYPIIVFCFLLFMMFGVTVFVLPSYSTAISEMTGGAQLPAITRSLLEFPRFIFINDGVLVGLIILLLLFMIILFIIRTRFRHRRPDKPYLVSRIGDFIKWHIPILHWFERNYSMVQVVEILRLSLNGGGTVNQAISNTINLDINNCFKKQLKRWLKKVEAGENIAESARRAKLGSTLAWAFDNQTNHGNTLNILETLENFYRTNYSYRVNLARFIFWPCTIILLGIMVGFVVLGIFLPIVSITIHATNMVIP